MSKFQVQRFSQSNAVPDSGTTITGAAAALNGILMGIIVDVPAMTSAHTVTATLKDADGYTVWSKASLTSGAVSANFVDANNQPYQVPLSGNHALTLTSSGTETGAKTIKVVLLIQRG